MVHTVCRMQYAFESFAIFVEPICSRKKNVGKNGSLNLTAEKWFEKRCWSNSPISCKLSSPKVNIRAFNTKWGWKYRLHSSESCNEIMQPEKFGTNFRKDAEKLFIEKSVIPRIRPKGRGTVHFGLYLISYLKKWLVWKVLWFAKKARYQETKRQDARVPLDYHQWNGDQLSFLR